MDRARVRPARARVERTEPRATSHADEDDLAELLLPWRGPDPHPPNGRRWAPHDGPGAGYSKPRRPTSTELTSVSPNPA